MNYISKYVTPILSEVLNPKSNERVEKRMSKMWQISKSRRKPCSHRIAYLAQIPIAIYLQILVLKGFHQRELWIHISILAAQAVTGAMRRVVVTVEALCVIVL